MQRFILTLITGLSYLISFSQTADDFDNNLHSIVSKIPEQISKKDDCEELIHITSRLSEDLEDAVKDTDSHDQEETRKLKDIQRHTDAILSFLKTAGSASGSMGFLKEKELRLVREYMAVELLRVSSGKFCCDVLLLQYGQYKCLLGFIKGDYQLFRLKVKISSDEGRSVTDLERGLETNEYGKLWSNEDELHVQDFKIISIACTKIL